MRRLGVLVALAAALTLVGCSTTGIAELDRAQLDSDKLDLPARYFDEPAFDPESIRWLAEHKGVDFYAARTPDSTCLIMVVGGNVEGSMAGCSQKELGVSGRGFPTAHLYIDVEPPEPTKSVTVLTPNLYVMEYVPE